MIQFAVVLKNAEWTVYRDGQPLVSGLTRSEAIAHAERLAFEAEEAAEDVSIVVQDYLGEMKTRYSGG